MLTTLNLMLGRGKGGLENTFVAYTKALSILNYTVHVIIDPAAAIKPQLDEIPNLNLHLLKQRGLWDIVARFKLSCLIKKIKPQIAFVHGGRGMHFLRHTQKKFPIIPVVANYQFKRVKYFQYVITMTRDLKSKLANSASISPENIFLLRHPVIIPNAIEEKVESSPLVIGALGRFVTKKGFETYLNALNLLKKKGISFKAILAGTGEEETKLKELATKLDLTNTLAFTGWLNPTEFFNQIDIFCLPSYHEPFGIVAIEALASKKSIVSTMSEGPSEILHDRHDALMVPIKDETALENALYEIIKNKQLRDTLSKNAAQTYNETYAFEKITLQLEKIIQTALQKSL